MLNVDKKLAASLHIDYPMLFELRNDAAERISHCGVLEFIAEEGMIYMPYWVGIQNLFCYLLGKFTIRDVFSFLYSFYVCIISI